MSAPMPAPRPEPHPWIASPWFKWSWLLVLAVVVLLNADFQFRWLPTSASGYAARGRADYNGGEYKRAVDNFTKALDREPQDAEAYIWRGESYAKLRDLDSAMKDLEKARQMRPDYPKALAAYGDGRAAAWDAAGAIESFSKALARDPNYVRCYLERGKSYYDTGQWAEARADLDKSAKLGLDDFRITSLLLGWAARAHAGDAYGASVALADLMKEGQIRGNRFWLSAQFLCGQIPETTYLASMDELQSGTSFVLTAVERVQGGDAYAISAESHFLAGVKRLTFGDRQGAATLLRKALETGADYTYAYDRARTELQNLLLGFNPMVGAQADEGLTVASVAPGGPAEAAGLRPGSIVTTIGGSPATQEALVEALTNAELGSDVEMTVADHAGAGAVPVAIKLDVSSPTR